MSKDIKVITVKEANKRAQFLEAVSFTNTRIIISADDQVYWGKNFLRSPHGVAVILRQRASQALPQSSTLPSTELQLPQSGE